mmetsp:Transcript_69592/g.225210  ORF Transcript_69592/g.225210 Transcript_69592/m.225210 type:complete len:231 (+) Transcript_69592:169-861(+)
MLSLLAGSTLRNRSTPSSFTRVWSMCSSSSSVLASTATRASSVALPMRVQSRCRMLIRVRGSTAAKGTALASVTGFLPSTSVFNEDPGSAATSARICASPMSLSPTSSSVRPRAAGSRGSNGAMSVRPLPSRKSSCTSPLPMACTRGCRAESGSSSSPKSHLTTEGGSSPQKLAQVSMSMPGLFETPTPWIWLDARACPICRSPMPSMLHPQRLRDCSWRAVRMTAWTTV